MQNKSYLFIGISALIHISVFGIISQQISESTPVEHGRSALSVEIIQSKSTVTEQTRNKPEAVVKDTLKSSATSKPHQAPIPVIKKTTPDSTNNLDVAKNVTISKSEITETATTTSTLLDQSASQPVNSDLIADKANEINTEEVIAVLQQELSKHFYYPKSAQRKNWQGLVILSFTIMPDGIIHKIEVNKSSGYDVLDSAAIDALKEIEMQSVLAVALNGNQLHQLLPVNYKLTY